MGEKQNFDIGRENHIRGYGVLNILLRKAEVCYVSLPPQVSSSRVHFAGVCCLTKLQIQRQEPRNFPTSSLHKVILKAHVYGINCRFIPLFKTPLAIQICHSVWLAMVAIVPHDTINDFKHAKCSIVSSKSTASHSIVSRCIARNLGFLKSWW